MSEAIGRRWPTGLKRSRQPTKTSYLLYPPRPGLATDQTGGPVDDPHEVSAMTQLPWTVRSPVIQKGQLAAGELTERLELSLAVALRF